MEKLHDKGIVHLNLNPDNIIVTDPQGLLDNSESGQSGEHVVLSQKGAA